LVEQLLQGTGDGEMCRCPSSKSWWRVIHLRYRNHACYNRG